MVWIQMILAIVRLLKIHVCPTTVFDLISLRLR